MTARRVAVVGYGVEGKAAVEYWRRSASVTVHDRNPSTFLSEGVPLVSGEGYLVGLDQYDLIVRSPGVRPELLPRSVPSTTVINEFLEKYAGTIIGVTGTQGKGTTATMIKQLLLAHGERATVAGNIGSPPLHLLDEASSNHYAVLELSSFQLMDLRRSPHISVVLAIAPDHLNWHTDFDEYLRAKSAIATHQRAHDFIIYDADNTAATRLAKMSSGTRISFGVHGDFAFSDASISACDGFELDRSILALRGQHNWRNFCAAVSAVDAAVTIDPEVVRNTASELSALPHRLQPVAAESSHVLFVNDSLSTSPATTIAAIATYPEPKILILGGSSKGADFTELAAVIATSNVKHCVLIGTEAPRILNALKSVGFESTSNETGSMRDVVRTVTEHALDGDVVLLSPACASFDRYRNYADRGDQFIAAVHAQTECA